MKRWYNDPAPLMMLEPMDKPPPEPAQEVPPRMVAAKPQETTRMTAGKPPDSFKP